MTESNNDVDQQIASNKSQGSDERAWFYDDNGKRKGPVTELEIAELIKMEKITYGGAVWKSGFSDWLKVEDTELHQHLGQLGPPPLKGEHVNNTIVWFLAFAPIIGRFLEYVVSGAIYGDNIIARIAVLNGKFWYVTLGLNIILCFWDERRLKKAGHNTNKFRGWIWLIPVYLYQRAKSLHQNLAYFIVWIVCFGMAIFNVLD